ncbi:MAG: peptidylprolyl isomerase [Myxococcota bacterium]
MDARTTVRIVTAVGAVLAAACTGGGPTSDTTASSPVTSPVPPPQTSPDGQATLPAWGATPAGSTLDAWRAGLVEAEFARNTEAPRLRRTIHDAAALRVRNGETARSSLEDRAALTLARIGGRPAAEAFVLWLGDGSEPVSAAMIGAVAMLAPPSGAPGEVADPQGLWATLENTLWKRYAVTSDPVRAEAYLLAIARTGGRRSVRNLGVDLQVDAEGLALPGAAARFEQGAQALAILCARGHSLTADAVAALGEGLATASTPVRRGAAYALSRCAGPSAERLAGPERETLVERLSAMVHAEDDTEAVAAWRAIEALGDAVQGAVAESVLGAPPPSWQVEVAAVRALGTTASGRKILSARIAAADLAAFEGARVHVMMEALRALRPAAVGSPELLEAVAGMKPPARSQGRRAKELALIRCEAAALQAIRTGELVDVRSCADGVAGLPKSYGSALAIDVLLAPGSALVATGRADALIAAATSGEPSVAAAAIAGLADLDDPRVNPLLRTTLLTKDVGLVSAAAGAIAARAADRSKRDAEAVAPLLTAARSLENDTAVEARVAAITALGTLARSAKPDGKSKQPAADPAWLDDLEALASDPNEAVWEATRGALWGWGDRVQRIAAVDPKAGGFSDVVRSGADSGADATGMTVHTDAGDIVIAFAGAPAPIAQSNLATLARGGFYDGLTFHRIVPGFVVQGGDPRGDGYGGPGHVMPCEWSNLRYERGTVGIALAGKDTGGSQIFITHGAPHHLDARYTVIGRVVSGLDAVDRLLPFDRITAVDVRTE